MTGGTPVPFDVMSREALQVEIWNRLCHGASLEDLGLPMVEGRMDLGGLQRPDPPVVRRVRTPVADVTEIQATAMFRGARWRDLDFSGSRLNALRLLGCEIENCRFDNCQMRDLRMWSTTLKASTFRRSNLRDSALGAVENGQRNRFSGVEFTHTDLRGSGFTAADFDHCLFRESHLEKIDFQTSRFSDCVFEGDLRDVIFHRRGFRGEAFPPNEMINVDFTRARLRDVGFRGLRLDRVRLPNDAEHWLIQDYPKVLDQLIETLQPDPDPGSRKLVAYLKILRKWSPPDQAQGVINLIDLTDVVGAEVVDRVRQLLNR